MPDRQPLRLPAALPVVAAASGIAAPAARWCCRPVGANGALDALDEFCAVPLPFAAR
jgi:hypothetical protein